MKYSLETLTDNQLMVLYHQPIGEQTTKVS